MINEIPTDLLPVIGFTAFVLFAAYLNLWLLIKAWWRKRQLGRIAERLGGTFIAAPSALPSADPEALQAILPGLKAQKARNLLTYEWSGVTFYLFDYRYKPSVRPYSTAEETVLVIDLDFSEVTPPQFIVRPRKRSDQLKERLGYTFVQIPDTHETLRKKFAVLSFEPDEQEITRLLNDVLPVIMEEFDPKRSHVVASGRFIIYSRYQTLMPAVQSHVEDYQTIGRYLLTSVASGARRPA